jgi:hypothetical protein
LSEHLSLADIALILIVIVGVVLSSFWFVQQKNHKRVYIYKDNVLLGTYSLTENRDLVIDSHNVVRIQDNEVMMLKSDCPDKRCVRQGKSDSLPIICLPNRVVVELKRDEKERSRLILY